MYIKLYIKEGKMAVQSSILAWKILWTKELSGLESMELQRVRHNLATEHSVMHNIYKILYCIYMYIVCIYTCIMLKILQARLQQYVNHELQMFKLVLDKVEEPETKLPTSTGSLKKQ